MKKKAFILPYGGDTCHNGSRLGIESLLRKLELERFITDSPEYEFEILLAAGSHPVFKEYPLLKELMRARVQHSLDQLFRNKMIDYMPTVTLLEPDVWNSSNESLSAALFLEARGVHELFVVSSETHKVRIKYIWSLIGGFTIRFVGAPTRRYWRSVGYEALAILKVFIKDRKLLKRRKYSTYQAAKSLAVNY